jgi:hypothetical protein
MVYAAPPLVFTPTFAYKHGGMQIILLGAQSELFWLTLKFDVKKNKLSQAVHFIGPEAKAKEFLYACHYVSVDGKTGSSFFSTTTSIFQQTDNVFTSSPHFQMDIDMFKKLFVDKDGRVPGYKLTVEKACQR